MKEDVLKRILLHYLTHFFYFPLKRRYFSDNKKGWDILFKDEQSPI